MLGSIPLPGYLDVPAKVQDAADEIDIQLGSVYVTPFSMAESGETALSRPTRLFLKRLNASLASGRILLQVAAPEEQRQLHAYAQSLVDEALGALRAIRENEYQLDAPKLDTGIPVVTVPLISNLDSESNVEAFYNRIANPNYAYPTYATPYVSPDGFTD